MEEHARFEWAQRNRRRVDRTQLAFAPVQRLVEKLGDDDLGRRVASAVGGIVDEEFRRYCRLASVEGGTVRIHVAHPSMVAHLQRRWLGSLSGGLRATEGLARAWRLTFSVGTTGRVIPELSDGSGLESE